MSSTEQKNVNQPFIQLCHTFGILGVIATNEFSNYKLDTANRPFTGLGATQSLRKRIEKSESPILDLRRLLPVLSNAQPFTRVSPLLPGITNQSRVFFGNQAVNNFAEGIISNKWALHFRETGAFHQASKHASIIGSLMAPGSYSTSDRTERNYRELEPKGEARRLRAAADCIQYFSITRPSAAYSSQTRRWCTDQRKRLGLSWRYSKEFAAITAGKKLNTKCDAYTVPPPCLSQKYITTNKSSSWGVCVYKYGSTTFIRIYRKRVRQRGAKNIHAEDRRDMFCYANYSEVFCFGKRDFDDLCFLLRAYSGFRTYADRRKRDARGQANRRRVSRIFGEIQDLYIRVLQHAGSSFADRNRVGPYFDVLQWRYLAKLTGNPFYKHSAIMAAKIESKGLTRFPPQEQMLSSLSGVGVDLAMDVLGIYKCSIYPEVDPFAVVADQYKLHMSRFDTEWLEGSPERERFRDTKAYMWYLGASMLHGKMGFWPGRIREGCEPKDWHSRYHTSGIPGRCWRDGCDIDLTGTVPVTSISEEQYVRQQDSACAPPHRREYASNQDMRQAPRRHKRKLLYTIQEDTLPNLESTYEELNRLGRELPDGYVGVINHAFSFSTDIVTGSRCERHKEAPRPFYAASSPWGCILSYTDGITRDFLRYIPQSMLGKSTRQKFVDISTVVRDHTSNAVEFLMSDDKAKYSPRMDPNSQQLPADFFAEVFNLPGIKAIGPIMYHNQLFYRVCGHLVSYNSNGTDREGMRGASNTWLEIVAQGLTTRLSRERGLTVGKSSFLSFIDDGLRKFAVRKDPAGDEATKERAKQVIEDVIFGLRVLGRELSWDKTFISTDLCVILNELMYKECHFSSGLKSFITAGDIELKPVMGATDYEQLYFSKMRGAHGVGAPLDLCHYTYIFETLMSHYTMGLRLQDNKMMDAIEYRMYCITPVALGGAGLRTLLQMGSNEVANATKEGIGVLKRLSANHRVLLGPVMALLMQDMEELSPIDFMREPDQFHVTGPRLKSQRTAAELRKRLHVMANNSVSRELLRQDKWGMMMLRSMGEVMMAVEGVSSEEVRLLYAITPAAFVDEFIQKLASSATLTEMLEPVVISRLRRAVRRDLIESSNHFSSRLSLRKILKDAGISRNLFSQMSSFYR